MGVTSGLTSAPFCRLLRASVCFAANLMLCTIPAFDAYGQESEIIAGGQARFEQYCASCHGSDGRGKGEMARWLRFPPTDLTRLQARNSGVFPFWEVYRAIDGRREVRGHGSREMPLWGFVFQYEGPTRTPRPQQDAVSGRIWQLVYYLESIQNQ